MSKKGTEFFIIEEAKLIVEILTGSITTFDGMQLKKREIADPKYNSSYSFLTDIRNADFYVSEEELDTYIRFLKHTDNAMNTRRSAILTKTPQHVSLAHLYSEIGKELSVEWQIFSTMEVALKWLRVDPKTIPSFILA
jgi:hypothetical protein